VKQNGTRDVPVRPHVISVPSLTSFNRFTSLGSSKNKTEQTKESFYEERDCMFDELPTYDKKNSPLEHIHQVQLHGLVPPPLCEFRSVEGFRMKLLFVLTIFRHTKLHIIFPIDLLVR
jgi:hypothetical protein